MADLMKGKTVNYKELAKTYDNFCVPSAKVTIGTTKYSTVIAQKEKMSLIHQLNARLYYQEGSSVSVLIGDVYDLESSQFKETVSLGEKMSVEIGYGSNYQQIFTGYVGEIQYQFLGKKQYVRITGFDAVSLMTQNYMARYYQNKKYSDLVSEIIGNYGKILASGKISSSNENPQNVISYRNINDYEYIQKVLSPLAGKEFYVFDGKAYFLQITERNQTPSVQLKLGQGLNDFRLTASYANLEINVCGFPEEFNDKNAVGKASAKMDGSQKNAVSSAQKQYMPFMRASSNQSASNVASYEIQRQIAGHQTAEGRCVGIPEIIPGRCISIQGIDSSYNSKKFWIDHVYHNISEKGFETEFFVKGWS